MNTKTLSSNWAIAKAKLKQKYGQLTDNDLTYVEGREEELIGRLAKLTGNSPEEIECYLDDECGCGCAD